MTTTKAKIPKVKLNAFVKFAKVSKKQITPLGAAAESRRQQDVSFALNTQLKQAFLAWLEVSTSHGVPNVVRAKHHSIRVIWLLFYLVSLSGMIYFISNSFVNFLQFQPVARVSVRRDYPTEFPAVTVCNLNPFNLEYVYARDFINGMLEKHNLSFILNSSLAGEFQDYAGTNVTDQMLIRVVDVLKRLAVTETVGVTYLDPLDNMTYDTRWYLGFDLGWDMLISCSFNKATCDYTQFLLYIDYNYGNCYTFNKGLDYYEFPTEILKTSKVGGSYGLQMELMTGNPNTPVKFSSNKGVFVIVHNRTMSQLNIEQSEGVYVAPGYDTFISVKREFRSKLSKPYSNCLTELVPENTYSSKLFEYMRDFNFTSYDQGFCYQICYQDQLIDKCSCATARTPIIRNAKYCTTASELHCHDEFDRVFSSTNIESFCNYACPMQCESIVYKLSSSIAKYPTSYYTNLLKDNLYFTSSWRSDLASDFNTVKNSILRVTINFDTLDYTVIEELPSTTVDNFIGYLGGTLGLFIGISLLSFIEVLEILIEFAQISIVHSIYERKNSVLSVSTATELTQ